MRTDLLQEKNGSAQDTISWMRSLPFWSRDKKSPTTLEDACAETVGEAGAGQGGVAVLGAVHRGSWWPSLWNLSSGKRSRNWLFLCLNRWACLPLGPTHFWELRKDRLWYVCGCRAQPDTHRENHVPVVLQGDGLGTIPLHRTMEF